MSSDFEVMSVGEFIEVTDYVANGSFASLKVNVEYKDTPDYAVLVRLADHNSGWSGNFVYVTETAYKFLKKSYVVPGDVIISNVGANAGTVFRAPDLGMPMTLGPNSVLLRPRKDLPYIRDYIYYFFSSPKGQASLQSILSGSAQPKFNKTDLRNSKIDVPKERNFSSYAKPLLDLDNKIQVNRQTNQTLEQIAQTIFKSWFVDFDPVRAKIAAREAFIQQHPEVTLDAIRAAAGTEGDTPTHAAAKACELAAMCSISGKTEEQLSELDADTLQQLKATAALFPDELVDSELGEVPEGWACGTLSDIGSFGEKRIELSELSLENYISTENMREGRKGITAASSLPSVKTVPAFNKGQILISNIRPYFKKIWLAQFEGGRSNDVLGFDAVDSESIEFLYNLLFQDAFFNFMMTTSKGAKMPRGDKGAIMGWTITIPGVEIRREYSNSVRNYYEIINNRNKENQYLADLKDTLLPKLLSGYLPMDEVA